MPFVDFPFCLKQVCQIVSVFAIALLPKLMRPLGDLFLAAQIFVILAVDCTHLLMPTRRTRRDSLVCGRSGLRPSPGLGDWLLEVLPHSPNQKCAGFPGLPFGAIRPLFLSLLSDDRTARRFAARDEHYEQKSRDCRKPTEARGRFQIVQVPLIHVRSSASPEASQLQRS